jgi:nitrogen fixation/metabolism regulation signal transduction histidine kinase
MILRAFVFSCIAIGIALIALMIRASSNNAFFGEHYTWLFGLGIALTIGLLVLIAYQVASLVKKLRTRVFGAKLAARLMAVFALMAIIPGGLLYAISVQFLNRSIDSWFDVPVDKALAGALNLSKRAIDAELTELLRKGRDAATRVAERSLEDVEALRQLRGQYGFDDIALFNVDGTPIADARSKNAPPPFSDKPTIAELRDVARLGPAKSVETLSDRTLVMRVVIAVPGVAGSGPPRAIQVVQAAPKNLSADLQTVDTGITEYAQLAFLRSSLTRLFALTLTLAMLLTLFSALALSFLLSERLSAPLSALADSTRAIAKGDFSKLNPVKSRDEFGVLTQSFNTMTRQLGEASDVVARKQQELENANTYLESILGHLTSGVLALDERLYIRTINENAVALLGAGQAALKGLKLPEWPATHPALKPLVELMLQHIGAPRDKAWERQLVFDGPLGKRSLLIRATKLPPSIDSGYVFVFDDVTGLIQAQRDAAWGEVARRLAHEIKNPLTPIQLSAERMQMKFADKLPPAERDILDRSTQTIVAQVAALKSMVDDFSLYSRSTRLKAVPVVLEDLVRDVLVLYESMHVTIKTDFAPERPTIEADPTLLRQVLHNLLQNAVDALADVVNPCIRVATVVEKSRVRLVVEDNGVGVKDDVIAHIFEPYVTTKPKGTGLGLAIVKKIVEEHRGTVAVGNVKPQGARVEIFLPSSLEDMTESGK